MLMYNVKPELKTVAESASDAKAGITIGGAMESASDDKANLTAPIKGWVPKFGQ